MKLSDLIPAFGRKVSETTRAVVALYMGSPVWTPVDYRSLAREGYNRNVWVYASIERITRAAKSVPWTVYRAPGNSRGRTVRLDDHPLALLMRRPNPEQGGGAFIESVIGYLLLAGNSYIEAAGPQGGPPRELWPLRPDRVRVLPDPVRRIRGYRYTAGGTSVDFEPEQVLHVKTFHPTDDFYGLSPIQAAARAVDQSNAADAWNAALLQNMARPPGALVAEGQLTDAQFERLKEQMHQHYQGAKNAGRPMLLEGGLDWKSMGLTPAEMDFLEGQKFDARKIAVIFGLDPALLGDSANRTYSNQKEARRGLYEDVVLPLLDVLRDELNNWLTPAFGDRLYLDYDRDQIDALQEDREQLWGRITAADWLTINEKRRATGYDDIPGGDVVLVSATMLPLDIAEADPQQNKAFNLAGEEAKTAHWKAIDRARIAWQGQVARRVLSHFQDEAGRVAEAVRSAPSTDAIDGAIVSAIDESGWERLYAAFYLAVMEDFGRRTLAGLKEYAGAFEAKDGDGAIFDPFTEEVNRFIEETVGKRVALLTATTRRALREAVREGIAAGESMDEIADRIRELYTEMSSMRAKRIARTEVIAASAAGSLYAAKSTNLPGLKKEWIATRDSRTRDSHAHLDGEIVPIDAAFPNRLDYPGDPSGPPEEVVNCRCTLGYHTEE